MPLDASTPERLLEFLEQAAETILMHDMQGRIVYANATASKTLGYHRDEMIGMPLWTLERTITPGKIEGAWSQLKPGKPVTLEARHRTKDGREFPVGVQLQVFETGDSRYAIAMCRDLTEDHRIDGARRDLTRELELARDEAAAANRAKSRFLANMSHELRTPLNAILGYTELLQEDVADLGVADAEQDLGRVHTSATHLLSLIDEVLDLAKIEAGQLQLSLEPVDLAEVLQEVAEVAGPLAKVKDNTIHLDVGYGLGVVVVDPQRLRQVLLNLLSNACRFTERGAVILMARADADRVRIEVRDTGIGIDPDRLDVIFEPFSQAEATTEREYGGTGLGLPISRRICTALSGTLTASSTPGKGSVFRVVLPRRAEIVAIRTPPPLARRQAQRRELLLVHTDGDAHHRVGDALRARGVQLRSAFDAEEALVLAKAFRVQGVVIDIRTPGGLELLEQLTQTPDLAAVPAMMVRMGHRVRVFDGESGVPLSWAAFVEQLAQL